MELSEIDLLQKFIANTSLDRLIKYTQLKHFKIEAISVTEKQDKYYGDQMSIIMLWGIIGSFVLKIHFETSIATTLAANALQKKVSDINTDMACDYMKEFCNLNASFIKGFFEKNNLLFGMSLPFLADGQDEIVFRKIRDPRAQYSVWKLSDAHHSLILTSEICLLEPKPIREIETALNKVLISESDEVQFF